MSKPSPTSCTTLSRTQAHGLVRGLNAWHATAIVAGTIIGSGIFLVPAEMMQAVGSARPGYLGWNVGGLVSFFGALTYAELGAMRPYAGGEYVYVRDAYGTLPAFLYGWTWFLIAKPASIATVTAGLVRVLGTFSAADVVFFAYHFKPDAGDQLWPPGRNCGEHIHHCPELHRSAQGGRISVGLHGVESRDDSW